MSSVDEEDFQRMWQIASTAQFVSAFQEPFKLPEIEIEILEEGLLSKSMYGIHSLKNLIVALLRGVYPTNGVRLDNYEYFLHKVVDKIWISEARQEDNPLKENTKFEDLVPISKLDILYSLCLCLLDKATDPRSKFKDQVSKMNGDVLRVQPLGCDDEGNEYWYFYGTRLYKQEPAKDKKIKDWEEEWNTQKNTSLVKRGRGRPRKIKPRKSDGESDESEESLMNRSRYMNLGEKSRWSVVCNTLDDWVEFAEKFKDSKSKSERALFRTVTDNFLPVINETYLEKEKKLQQKLRELIPKQTFTRMETRPRRTKSTSDSRENDAKSREHRLEERNRRLNQSAETESRRRSRSRISYDENYDDVEDEPRRRRKKRSSYVEDDMEDFVETSAKMSKDRELMVAKANEIMNEYVSLVSKNSDNKSQVLRVFTQVKFDKNSYPFHYAVEKKEFPDYYDIISEPMDLSRIERKLRLNIYKTAAEIDDDFKMMVENCELYFGVDSERSKMGRHTWRLFRRLMKELPVTPKQSENASASNATGAKECPNSLKERKTSNGDSARSERARKKQKKINCEALEMLSKEAELAIERSQSMDEEHFRHFTQKGEKFTKFSDLIVEPIHSHPSDLIQKFMSDSSNQGNEETNSDESPSLNNKKCDNPTSDTSYNGHNLPENMEVNDNHETQEENSNSSQFMDKNDPKSFNILSSDNEANLEILSDNEIDLHSVSNSLSSDFADTCFRDRKSSDGDMHNLSGSPDNPSSNNPDSSLSQESDNSSSSPNTSSNTSPNSHSPNSTFFNGYQYANFAPENESNGSSTVDASCLGLASASIYKKHQPENETKTSVTENISQIYNGNQNLTNGFGKVNPRTQVFPRNRPKASISSSDDQLMQDQFSHQEISRGESTIQAFQAMQAPMANEGPSKNSPPYSYSSDQFIQGQINGHDNVKNHQSCSPTIAFSEETQRQISGNYQTSSPDQFIQEHINSHDNVKNHQPCSPTISFSQERQGQVSGNHQASSPDQLIQGQINEHGSIKNQLRCSPTISFPQETERQIPGNHQTSNPDQFIQRQINGHDTVKIHQRHSPTTSFSQEMQEQVSGNQTSSPDQFIQGQINNYNSTKNQPRCSPTISLSQEMQKQVSGNHQRSSPIYYMHQEMQNPPSLIQEHSKNQSRHSVLPSTEEIQESEMFKSRYYSSLPNGGQDQQRHSFNTLHDESQQQRPLKSEIKNSSISNQNRQEHSTQARFNSHHEVENGEKNGSQSMVSATICADQQSGKSQPRFSPNAPFQPPAKKSANIQGNSFSTSHTIEGQESAIIQSRFSPTFSNQALTQESAKSSPQNTRNESPSVQNQIPVELPAFDFGNIFSNTTMNNTAAQVSEPSFSSNSSMQIPPQVPFTFSNQNQTIRSNWSNSSMQMSSQVPVSNQNHATRPIFPTMKFRLPPSSGELIMIPGDPSTMTFHLLAKPSSDPSQTIQLREEIHAVNPMRNQGGQANSNDESASARSKNSVNQGIAPRKQTSPILDLQQLALNPRKSSTSPSSMKNKSSDDESRTSRSAEPNLKSPPAIANDSSVMKPNAVLVRPLEPIHTSASSMPQHSRNINSFQQEAFVQQQTEGPKSVPIIFSKGNRVVDYAGNPAVYTNSVSAMSLNTNSQRHIIPTCLPNAVVQNGNGQYMFVPSKDILQNNVDQNLKVKNPERPPAFYPSNMVQNFSFQNGQINPAQMLPQVHLPYVPNPYYIVTNPSAFQNASRYPVMNMQPIPFQNR